MHMERVDKAIKEGFSSDRQEDVQNKTNLPDTGQAESLPADIPQIVNRIQKIANEILGLTEHKVPVEKII